MFSSRLGLAVVCGIIFRSGHTITTFLLAFKNQKYMFLVKKKPEKCNHASEADINARPYLENIRIVTRRVCFKVLGYSRYAIWKPKKGQKSNY